MTFVLNEQRIEINNIYINYEDIKCWGFDNECFIIYTCNSQSMTCVLPMNKHLYRDFEQQIKERIKALVNNNNFQSTYEE